MDAHAARSYYQPHSHFPQAYKLNEHGKYPLMAVPLPGGRA